MLQEKPADNQLVNMTRILLLASFSVAIVSTTIAQQDPQFTQWYMEPAAFNPAVAGNSELTCVSGTYRNQWEGLDRDPNTSMLTAHTFVDALKGGVMLSAYSDALGQETNTLMKLGYAYHLEPLSNGAIVSLGMAASMFSKTLGNEWIAIDDYTQDQAIPNNKTSSSAIDLDLGIFIRKPGSFYAGLSTTHLMETELADLSMQPRRHVYAMGGYNHPLDGDYLVLRTNVLAKTDLAATIADINVNVLWDNMLWAGVSWRPTDASRADVWSGVRHGRQAEKHLLEADFRLGYSYDATTSELRNYSSGSHEVFLSYCFKFESIPVKNRYANPRFL